jgi:hypothetical protein
MSPFETHLPTKTVSSVVSTPLATALANPVPVLSTNPGVTISPIPNGGVFDVPLDALIGGGR